MFSRSKVPSAPQEPRAINSLFLREKFIFIHIPKCAGSSLSLHILGYQVGHRAVRHYEHILGSSFAEYFSFSFVRHPLDRFLSAYGFLAAGGMTAKDRETARKLPPPNDVLAAAARGEYAAIHFRPQIEFLKSHDGGINLTCVHRIEDDFAGFFELCKHSLGSFHAERIGKAMSADERRNTGPRTLERDGLDMDLLRTAYDEDFWRFDYR